MCCFWQGLPNNAIHSTFNLGMFAHWSLYHFFLKKELNFQIINDLLLSIIKYYEFATFLF